MNRGRRYESTHGGSLNVKKIFAVFVAVAVIAMCVVVIKYLLNKGDKSGGSISSVNNYYVSYKDNKWGVINSKGDSIIDPSYQELIVIPNSKKDVFLCTYDVNYDTAEYKTKALNKNNQEIFEEYDQVEPMPKNNGDDEDLYEENVIKVMKDGKYGIIDLDGKEIIPTQYKSIKVFGENDIKGYIVENEDGKVGLVDTTNNQVLETKYEDIENVHGNNLYVVTIADNKKIIDKNNQEIATSGFDEVTQISEMNTEGSGIIFKKDEKYGFMDFNGNIKIEPTYDMLQLADTNTLIAKKDNLCGIIDASTQEEKMPYQYSGISFIKEAGIYILEDQNYSAIITNRNFEQKLAGIVVEVNEELDYIKLREESEYKYYNFEFEEQPASTFLKSNSIFLSKQDGKYGFVDSEGNVIVDYQYDDATELNEDGYAAVNVGGQWGCIDKDGKTVVDPIYDLDDYLEIDFVGIWHKGRELNMNYYTQE